MGIPRARAASRVATGTRRRASSDVRATTGIMIVARAITAAIALVASLGLPTFSRLNSKMIEKAKIPTTMDGICVITSLKNRRARPRRLFPYSET